MCHSGHRMQQQPQHLHADKEVRSILLEAGKPDGSLGSHSVLSQLLLGACASWQHASCCLHSNHCHPFFHGGMLVMVHVGLVACLRNLHAQHVAQSALGTGRLSSLLQPAHLVEASPHEGMSPSRCCSRSCECPAWRGHPSRGRWQPNLRPRPYGVCRPALAPPAPGGPRARNAGRRPWHCPACCQPAPCSHPRQQRRCRGRQRCSAWRMACRGRQPYTRPLDIQCLCRRWRRAGCGGGLRGGGVAAGCACGLHGRVCLAAACGCEGHCWAELRWRAAPPPRADPGSRWLHTCCQP